MQVENENGNSANNKRQSLQRMNSIASQLQRLEETTNRHKRSTASTKQLMSKLEELQERLQASREQRRPSSAFRSSIRSTASTTVTSCPSPLSFASESSSSLFLHHPQPIAPSEQHHHQHQPQHHQHHQPQHHKTPPLYIEKNYQIEECSEDDDLDEIDHHHAEGGSPSPSPLSFQSSSNIDKSPSPLPGAGWELPKQQQKEDPPETSASPKENDNRIEMVLNDKLEPMKQRMEPSLPTIIDNVQQRREEDPSQKSASPPPKQNDIVIENIEKNKLEPMKQQLVLPSLPRIIQPNKSDPVVVVQDNDVQPREDPSQNLVSRSPKQNDTTTRIENGGSGTLEPTKERMEASLPTIQHEKQDPMEDNNVQPQSQKPVSPSPKQNDVFRIENAEKDKLEPMKQQLVLLPSLPRTIQQEDNHDNVPPREDPLQKPPSLPKPNDNSNNNIFFTDNNFGSDTLEAMKQHILSSLLPTTILQQQHEKEEEEEDPMVEANVKVEKDNVEESPSALFRHEPWPLMSGEADPTEDEATNVGENNDHVVSTEKRVDNDDDEEEELVSLGSLIDHLPQDTNVENPVETNTQRISKLKEEAHEYLNSIAAALGSAIIYQQPPHDHQATTPATATTTTSSIGGDVENPVVVVVETNNTIRRSVSKLKEEAHEYLNRIAAPYDDGSLISSTDEKSEADSDNLHSITSETTTKEEKEGTSADEYHNSQVHHHQHQPNATLAIRPAAPDDGTPEIDSGNKQQQDLETAGGGVELGEAPAGPTASPPRIGRRVSFGGDESNTVHLIERRMTFARRLDAIFDQVMPQSKCIRNCTLLMLAILVIGGGAAATIFAIRALAQ